jgi:hypothetical protein
VVAASTSPGPMILRRSPNARGVSSRAIVVADSSLLKRSLLPRTTAHDRRRLRKRDDLYDVRPQMPIAWGIRLREICLASSDYIGRSGSVNS